MIDKKLNTGFLSVFDQKMDKLTKKIKREFDKPKKERDKDFLKRIVKEAKQLRKLIRKCRDQEGCICCPNCGHEFGVHK